MTITETKKDLNHTITKGNGQSVNSVNATIVQSPGFNGQYLGKLPGILKLLELLLAIICIALVASQIQRYRPQERFDTKGAIYRYDGSSVGTDVVGNFSRMNASSYPQEILLNGETYFLAANSAAMTMLVIVLIAYLFHTVSSIVVPKTSTVENVMNLVLALMLIAAGITEIVMTSMWRNDPDIYHDSATPNGMNLDRNHFYRPLMDTYTFGLRIAAGALALLNGILFLISFTMSRKELNGPGGMESKTFQ